MIKLGSLLTRSMLSNLVMGRIVQGLCFVAAPAILVLGISKGAAMATTSSEVLNSVLACSGLSVSLVVLGVVVPLVVREVRV